MPRDRFTLAVLVGCEEEFFGVLQLLLDVADARLLIGVHHIDGFEVVVGVHTELRPGQPLVFGGEVACADGEVADVADGGRHGIVGAEVALDRLRLRGGFHDDEMLGCHGSRSSIGLEGSPKTPKVDPTQQVPDEASGRECSPRT